MASDLKKVGLVFNADGSTDFVKSLKNISASLQENYADFKLVQTQYDKNTSTSQKLADKLEYLNSAYDLQKNKVRVLQEELEELSNAENKDEVAITKKQTALKNAETQLAKYESQIKQTSKEIEYGTANLKDMANKIDQTADKMQNIGKKASIATAAITTISASAVKSFDEVDAGADNVIKATGAIDEQADALEESYKKVASSIVGDFSEIGSGLGEVNTRFGFVGEELETCTQKFLKFAEINNTDVVTSVQLVSRAMGDANIDSSEYASVLDALTSASQASGISIDKLTENITKYGAPMRALGYDTKESIAIFASWEKAGVNTEIAFSGMKNAISSFSAQGKNAKEEFKKVLEEIKNCPDIYSATTKAIDVFGKKAGPDLADAIKAGRFEFETMLKVIESSEGTVDNTFDEIQDGGEQAKLSMQKAKIAMSEFGEIIMNNLAPLLEKAAKGLERFSKWFNGLDSSSKNTILTIGLVVAAVGPLLILLGTFSKSISNIIKLATNENTVLAINAVKKGAVTLATKAWQVAQIGLNGVLAVGKIAISGISTALSFLAANPIVLVIAGIAALVAGLIYLWNTSDKFRDSVAAGWAFIQEVFQGFDDFLTNIFQTDWSNSFGIFGEILNSFLANISNFYEAIKQIFQGIIDTVTGVFTGNWEQAWNGVLNIFQGIFNGLLSIAKIPLNGIIGFLNILISGINLLIKGLNKIHFDVPDWIPGLGGKRFGFNIKEIGKIPYLAKGGTLLSGAAIVAEAGPELLLQQGNKTKVVPLSNTNNNDNQQFQKEEITVNTTINNNSKYISPAENARQLRKELQWYFLTKKGRSS